MGNIMRDCYRRIRAISSVSHRYVIFSGGGESRELKSVYGIQPMG